MDQRINLRTRINGWGADLDPEQRPGVPKERKPRYGTGAHWRYPDLQMPKVKIHCSAERPGLTPVFGSTCPPSGLSGLIRNVAYRLSEARVSRWLLLLFADRINVFEGIIDDIRHGRVPNPWAETGLRAELRYNRQLIRPGVWIAGAGLLALGGVIWAQQRSKSGVRRNSKLTRHTSSNAFSSQFQGSGFQGPGYV